MKKSTIAFIAVLSLVFALCDDDWTEALPQVNPQEQAFAVDDITLKSIVPEAVNLQEACMKDNKVKLFTESVDNLPAGSKIRYELQFSKTADFAKYGTLVCEMDSDTAVVKPLTSRTLMWQLSAAAPRPSSFTCATPLTSSRTGLQ